MQLLFLLSLTFIVSYSFQPELTLYMGYDATGNGIILRSKESSVRNVAPEIIANYKSACFSGFWVSYNSENYFAYTVALGNWSPIPYCYNSSSFGIQILSARYLGPSNTETPSISFYYQAYWQGTELIVEGNSYDNLPFVPKSVFSNGGSNWTLFSGSNFDGTATCFVSTNDFHTMSQMNSTINNIHSVKRHCNGRIDKYFIPDEQTFVSS